MKLLLEHGSKINEKSLYGSCDYPRLPIEAAVHLNDFEKIKFLLTNGADVNSPHFKNSLLEKAIYNYGTYSFDEQKEKMETASSIVSLLLDYHAPLEFLDWEKMP
jgi:ankyrin repeat protein